MTLHADLHLEYPGFKLSATFDATPREPLVLIGPNGSGKSTIADLLAGIRKLDTGSIKCNGTTLATNRKSVCPQRRNVGIVFQHRHLFPTMSARENIAFGPRARGQSKRDANRTASKWLDRFDLTTHADKLPNQLSGGQAQRVALARALATDPDLLILDEPLAALDSESKPWIRRDIALALEEFQGISICITHDPIEARALAKRIAVVESGTIVQIGTPEDLERTPRSAFTAAFVGINLFAGTLASATDKPAVINATHLGYPEDSSHTTIRIAPNNIPDRTEVLAAIHPRAIILSNARPDSSARNAHHCTVEAIDPIHGALRITLAGPISCTAEITDDARADLNITVGTKVWASFKATEIRVFPR